MKVLLISMPDAIALFYAYRCRIANLGLCSLAGNLNISGCQIRTLDLIFFRKRILRTVKEALSTFRPQLIGLSSMSFQYGTAKNIARFIRDYNRNIKIVLGGYHPTIMYDEIFNSPDGYLFDFIIRGEGEFTFDELVKKLIGGKKDFEKIKGLSFKIGKDIVHNPPRELVSLDKIRLPKRNLSLFKLKHGVFKRAEAVETSRGCLMECNFCSINLMYGKNYREYDIERVIEDIKVAKGNGAVRIMFSDDNLTMNPKRVISLCKRIIEEKLNSIYFATQASVKGIAYSEEVAKIMKEANFCVVFLGIENIERQILMDIGKGDILEKTYRAISYLKKNDIGIMGGFMIGHPEDDANSIKAVFSFAKKVGIDYLMTQIVTPYPKTKLRSRLLELGLVANKYDYSRYNGYGCNVRTKHLDCKSLERLVIWENVKWFTAELFNPNNWFARSRRVRRRVYVLIFLMTINLIFYFLTGRFWRSNHRNK